MKRPIIFSLLILSLFSCKKEGCTDADSINFDADAKTSDNSCQFEGDIIFWYGQTASAGLINDQASSLTFYLDDDIIGSTATNVFWTSSPDCGQNATITATKSLAGSKSNTYSYSVKDQSGWEYWNGNVTISANQCASYELSW